MTEWSVGLRILEKRKPRSDGDGDGVNLLSMRSNNGWKNT